MKRPRRTPLPMHLRRRRRRRLTLTAVALTALALLAMLDRRGWFLYAGDDWARYHGKPLTVQRVIDGDTLVVDVPDRRGGGSSTHVRVWGIDTPELAKPEQGQPAQPLAEEAAALTRSLCAGNTVTLTLERQRMRDRYGRLLAHVWLDDGSLLADRLLLAGLAQADDRWSHQHQERFTQLRDQARHDKVGLWTRDLRGDFRGDFRGDIRGDFRGRSEP